MAALPPIDWDRVPSLVAGLLLLVPAAFILILDWEDRLNRAFALLLFLIGCHVALFAFTGRTVDGREVADPLFDRLRPYFLLAHPFAALNFGLLYRRRYFGQPSGTSLRTVRWTLLMLAVATQLLYLVNHGLYADSTGFGPLYALEPIAEVSFALIALMLAHDFSRTARAPLRLALLLASLGFVLGPLYRSSAYVFDRIPLIVAGDSVVTFPLFWTRFLLFTGATVVACLALAQIVGAPIDDASTRRLKRRYAILWIGAIGSAFLVQVVIDNAYAYLRATLDLFSVRVITGLRLLAAFWTAWLPILVTYALARHRLFGVDARTQLAVKAGTIATVFASAIFVTAEAVAKVLGDVAGVVAGAAIAAGLLLLVQPLQRWADRVARRVMPSTKPLRELGVAERVALYEEQATLAWSDGVLSRKERLLLDQLRHRLDLSFTAAMAAEERAAGFQASARPKRAPRPRGART